MRDPIVLIHGSANGSYSWRPVIKPLQALGAEVFAPDMLGYGNAPKPSERYSIEGEVTHLQGVIEAQGIGQMHLVMHSLGSLFGLHLRRVLGPRVTRLTLIDPVLVSILVEQGEAAGAAEMEGQYERFMGRFDASHEAAARGFVEHWSGDGSWGVIGERARQVITGLAPRLKLEMIATRNDTASLADLTAAAPPTTILVGERTLEAPRATARLLARGFGAKTLVVPGAAHMIPLTHPTAVVEAIWQKEAQ